MAAATPEQEAVEYYNDGVSYRDKADTYEKEAAAETDGAKKAKLLGKARTSTESSIKKYLKAHAKDPHMVPAWSSLGYAYRKTGKYLARPRGLRQGARAGPGYTPAIEYRAEAYLGLDRLDEVKIGLHDALQPRPPARR